MPLLNGFWERCLVTKKVWEALDLNSSSLCNSSVPVLRDGWNNNADHTSSAVTVTIFKD